MKMKLDTKTASNKCKNPEPTLLHFLGGCPKSLMLKSLNECKKISWIDEKKLQEFFIGLFTPKSGIFWVQPVRDTKLKCAQTSKRTIPCKGITTPRFLAEYANIPVGIYLLKVSNRNIRTRCKILTIVNFEHIIAGWDKKMFKVHENASLTIFLRKELC